MYNINK